MGERQNKRLIPWTPRAFSAGSGSRWNFRKIPRRNAARNWAFPSGRRGLAAPRRAAPACKAGALPAELHPHRFWASPRDGRAPNWVGRVAVSSYSALTVHDWTRRGSNYERSPDYHECTARSADERPCRISGKLSAQSADRAQVPQYRLEADGEAIRRTARTRSSRSGPSDLTCSLETPVCGGGEPGSGANGLPSDSTTGKRTSAAARRRRTSATASSGMYLLNLAQFQRLDDRPRKVREYQLQGMPVRLSPLTKTPRAGV